MTSAEARTGGNVDIVVEQDPQHFFWVAHELGPFVVKAVSAPDAEGFVQDYISGLDAAVPNESVQGVLPLVARMNPDKLSVDQMRSLNIPGLPPITWATRDTKSPVELGTEPTNEGVDHPRFDFSVRPRRRTWANPDYVPECNVGNAHRH